MAVVIKKWLKEVSISALIMFCAYTSGGLGFGFLGIAYSFLQISLLKSIFFAILAMILFAGFVYLMIKLIKRGRPNLFTLRDSEDGEEN